MDSIGGLPVNAVDIAVALVLLISGVLAYARGFVHETLAVGGWIGAFFATIKGYPYAQPYARELIPATLLADFTAGVVIFVVTLVVLSMVTRAISARVKESALNVLDRSLGFLFGLVRGAVIVSVAYLGLEFLVPKSEQPIWVTSAKTLPLVERGAEVLASMLPVDSWIKVPDIDAGDVGNIIDLVQPSPQKAGKTKPAASGYSDTARKGINQLIENSQ